MAADPGAGPPERPSRYQPLAWLIALLAIALVAAIVFAPYLIIPIVILIAFYAGFSLIDFSRRR